MTARKNGNGHVDSTTTPREEVTAAQEQVDTQAAAAKALAQAEQAAAEKKAADALRNTPPAGLSPTALAMWLCQRSGKSKPSTTYRKPKADTTGFQALPTLSVRVKGWTATAIATELEAQAEKSVGGMAHMVAGSDDGWKKGEGNVSGADMSAALRVLQAAGCIR